jgi:chromosome segregation ATPase
MDRLGHQGAENATPGSAMQRRHVHHDFMDDDDDDNAALFDATPGLSMLSGHYGAEAARGGAFDFHRHRLGTATVRNGANQHFHDDEDDEEKDYSDQTSRLTATRKQLSPFRQHEQQQRPHVTTSTAQALQDQQQLIFQLRAQLSDALLEVQSSREHAARSASAKEKEVSALQRDVQHWKDEVLTVRKQNHELARELRREHERRAELVVQAERMRLQADRRVPDIVADEFRLRLDTALEARSSAVQSLSSALQLLSMSVGDSIAHKYLTQSLDGAALLHSKMVVSLQSRVRELEDELSLARDAAGLCKQ